MIWLARVAALVLAALALPAQAQDSEELAALVRANRWAVTAEAKGLAGPGAEKVAGWADKAQFFLLGENHGNAGMARFATALSRTLAPLGYGYTALEVDPLMIMRLSERMRAGGKPALAAWLREDKRGRAIPFYFWSEEADFIAASLERGALWGLDQSFVGAAHLHLDEIAARSVSPEVKAQAKALSNEARADAMGFLGKVDVARLKALRAAMPKDENGDAVRWLNLLIESAEIYGPFTTGIGSAYAANLARETRMKLLFLAGYEAAVERDRDAPKVLFKLGSNHLQRGISPTHVPTLGGFVSDTAVAAGVEAFNLRMICGPGNQAATFDGKSYDCAEEEFTAYKALEPYLVAGGDTLFDLRALRYRTRAWKDWPEDLKTLIWTYDAVVVIGPSKGSAFLAPLP